MHQQVSFGQIEMRVPDGWGVHATGNSAVVGILAGGSCDVPLRVEIHYTKDIESLAPTCCPQHWPQVPVTGVHTVEVGEQRVGDQNAEFRRFGADCADQKIERRAWLLPEAQVAIVEQQADPANELVVRNLRVGSLKDVTFENVTFHVPPSWDIATDGATARIGRLPGGERDAQLTVTRDFGGLADDLAPPPDCGPGVAPAQAEVAVIESGTRRLDGATADYRKFVVRCPEWQAYPHRAWVLPESRIAIFEDRESPDVDEVEHVVTNATVH